MTLSATEYTRLWLLGYGLQSSVYGSVLAHPETEVTIEPRPKKLRVFHDAHALTLAIYKNTRNFPKDEWFGIRAQLRRAAVSVPSNLVEGNARSTTRDYQTMEAEAAAEKEKQTRSETVDRRPKTMRSPSSPR